VTATKLAVVAPLSPDMVPPGTNASSAEPLVSSLRGRSFWRIAGLALALTLGLQASDAHADIYRYVDKDGVIHFSNATKRGKLVAKGKRGKGATGASSAAGGGSTDRAKTPDEYDAYIREAASLYQIPEALVRAVIRVESNFDARAISRANAQGLMQLIPATAERMLVSDPFDARQNVLGGTRYLRVLANLFNGNLQLTLAAYNAGEGAVIKYNGIPPYEETQAYVGKVLEYYNIYRGKDRI
jgi:soluble lytic murein transglycosylase-like protein